MSTPTATAPGTTAPVDPALVATADDVTDEDDGAAHDIGARPATAARVQARGRWRRRTLVTAVAGVLLLAGCSADPPVVDLPGGPDLVARSATAMRAVTSASFAIAVTGQLPELTITKADGVLTAEGDAQGTATALQFGQLLEVEFVVTAGDLYLKGPTGGYTKLAGAFADAVYDPTAILDPDRGVVKVVESMSDPTVAGRSDGGYQLTGGVPQAVAVGLAPGITSDVAATVTVDAATSRVTDLRFDLDGADGQAASVGLTFADFDQAVSITPPS
ncbi:LppX_LprAFG lipoprotein [Nakamurella flavida]|uniref:LppX_LprAFG lipoprotein n=1 Tax=Nakamurella flavida TaxID=363630 RepID=A0A939C192_9ACTN|nr:LppX_LprAFG lipoprotein [Nakamurella flavida]MBM9475215.1 LppX_LprAFG lipoprotein [Nakamurella flavida]MDP9776788.1 lipoprotein LprG [Nakamurella flavida]